MTIKSNCVYLLDKYFSLEVYSYLIYIGLIAFVYQYLKLNSKITVWRLFGPGLFVAGAFLNTFERHQAGCVRDYLTLFGYLYFNMYDLMVVVGVILMIIELLLTKRGNYAAKNLNS